MARPKMTLNLDGGSGSNSGGNAGQSAPKKPGGLSLGLPLEMNTARGSADLVDVELPLERQGYVLDFSFLGSYVRCYVAIVSAYYFHEHSQHRCFFKNFIVKFMESLYVKSIFTR